MRTTVDLDNGEVSRVGIAAGSGDAHATRSWEVESKVEARRVGLLLFALFLVSYLFTASGQVNSVDGWRRFGVTASLVESGRFDIDRRFLTPADMGSGDEPVYLASGIGQSLASVPFYLASREVSRLAPSVREQMALSLGASLLNQVVGSLLAVAVFAYALALGYSARISVAVALLFGFGTMAWQQSKDGFEHPMEALFFVLAALGTRRWGNGDGGRWLALSGGALGLGLMTRLNSSIAVPVFLLYLAVQGRRRAGESLFIGRDALPALAQFGVPLLLGLGISLAYNLMRFGGLLHGPPPEGENALAGLTQVIGNSDWPGRAAGLLIGPGKGLIWYNPVLWLLPLVAMPFWRRCRSELVLLLGVPLAYLGFYSTVSFAGWTGDWCWGPRYIFGALPFLVIPLAELFAASPAAQVAGNRDETRLRGLGTTSSPRRWTSFALPAVSTAGGLCRGLARKASSLPIGWVVWAIVLASLLVQVSSVLVSFRKWLYKLAVGHTEAADLIWNPADSPLLRQWETVGENVGNLAAGVPLSFGTAISSGDLLARSAQLNSIDFWWVKLVHLGVPPWLALLPGLALLASAVLLGWVLWRETGSREATAERVEAS